MFTETCAKIDENTALDMAVEAIKEIQQYRALEQKLQSVYGEHDGLLEIIVNGLVQYENAPDEARRAVLLTDDDVDEYKALKEKNEPKKAIILDRRCENEDEVCVEWKCPVCGLNVIEEPPCQEYCQSCGTKLDWN